MEVEVTSSHETSSQKSKTSSIVLYL